MPIKNMKQEIIGAFQVLNKLNGIFSEEDEQLMRNAEKEGHKYNNLFSW